MRITSKQEFQNALKVPNKIDCFDDDILRITQKAIKEIIKYINEFEDTHDLIVKYKKTYMIIEIVFNQDGGLDLWKIDLNEYKSIVGEDKLQEMIQEYEEELKNEK